MFTFETFESRRLMSVESASAKLSHTGTLFITGTEAAETIRITQSQGGGYAISVRGAPLTLLGRYGLTSRIQQDRYRPLYDLSRVKRIAITGADGNDEITVSTESDVPLNVRGGAGDDKLTMGNARSHLFGDAGNDIIDVAGQSLTYTRPQFEWTSAGGDTGTVRNVTYPGLATARSILNATGTRIDGGDGNDLISTRGTEDSVYGGAGDDVVVKRNDLDIYHADLPALPPANGSNDALSRLAIFGVESVVSETAPEAAGLLRVVTLTGTIVAPVVVRRNTIDALRA